jgi:vacuolar-type H+-ATPase subunit E/Vma4
MQMANEIIHGAEKLKERILSDARADAEKTEKETEAACDALRMEADRENALSMQAAKKQREEAVSAVLERSRTNAELFGRKLALQKRREVLDRVFDSAYIRLCGLDEEARADVCVKMLLREAEGAEEIKPAKAERALLIKQLTRINARLKEKGVSPLTMAQEDAEGMEHGFLLAGNGYEKDCSFRALLRDARAAEDTKVAAILFD